MASGLDTGLQAMHYLSRRVTVTTPFIGLGVLLGEIPATAALVAPQALVTEVWGALSMLFSVNPDLSAPFMTIAGAAMNALGYGNATPTSPGTDYLRTGRIYMGVPGAAGTGAAIVTLRFFPKTNPSNFVG